ncbi:DUF397 domain-containing protein [Streptomyces syringium]|uniref:DUF397 domain-containing protein n=1 Tax=Streptomyces syringium TaxID=76729 RepID=A0ABS4Y6V6_9ACTN|nr:DUF397 domain-containing protein [Streptomyces syringium]MBP2404464.1 hypothetical protein [Streptomyces syringium]SPE57400.1 hypothetical protein SNS2_3070 [Streptomyces netropsis]
MSQIAWQKSSFSGDRDDCIELGRSEDAILVRESDDPGVIVTTSPDKLRAFLLGVKAGEFDHLI